MKSYISKNFNEDIKNIDIMTLGVYYDVPIENFANGVLDKLGFEIEDYMDYVICDERTIDKYAESWDNVTYNYTDDYEIDLFINDLMNCKAYNHYLVVGYNCTWNGASGYKICNDYKECFIRDYDVSMYVRGSSAKGKYLQLVEYSHDVPMGHTTLVIGLTEQEYQKITNANIDDILKFGTQIHNKIIMCT